MDFSFYIRGLIVGFSIAAPIGPIGVLVINRTLHQGLKAGLCSGLGAALAATTYASIVAFGLTFISDFILQIGFWLRLFGGAFLIYLGIKIFLSRHLSLKNGDKPKSPLKYIASTYLLNLVNPMTLVSYLALFAGLDLADTHGQFSNALLLTLGIFSGGMCWWSLLTKTLTYFHHKITLKTLKIINKIAGVLIIGFGIFAWFNDFILKSFH
jgi:threonine/homoserine/homoserine lactone efflux protein